jgi:DUF3048 family protein
LRGSKTGRLGAALVTLLLLSAACSGDDAPEVAATPIATPTPTPTPPETTCPLTGKDPEHGVDITRAAIAIKVEDSPEARPQSGLEHADLVFEEIVEGGITRFMAIFHCGDAPKVGPVRSARFDDPKIGKPFTKLLIYSGANSIVQGELEDRKMLAFEENEISGSALFRDPPGSTSVHSLFANTKEIRKLPAAKRTRPPERIFEFGLVDEGAKKARSVSLNFTAGNTIEWRWQGNSWRRFEAGAPFFVGTGDQIAVPNVLVQEVEVDNSCCIRDVAGNPSPDIKLEGSGRALLFRDGKVIKGRWTISSRRDAPVFETKSGDPLVFAPGPIWVELVPSKAGDVKGAIAFR